ncbi:MAG: hypothetical protein D6772_11800 [Bacteroidetes bacterium]|nr:MAG: hypothetical protein D6772_11800 [Bacteroidota bacterium]
MTTIIRVLSKVVFVVILLCSLPSTAAFSPNSVVRTNSEKHDFHISKARIEYASANEEWQFSIHIFIDDLELALAAGADERFFLGSEREVPAADSLIYAYLRDKIDFVVDAQAQDLQWLGKELTEDLSAFWVYLYVPEAAMPHELSLSNRILLELYEDQQNIVQLIGPGGSRQHLLFHRDQPRKNLIF